MEARRPPRPSHPLGTGGGQRGGRAGQRLRDQAGRSGSSHLPKNLSLISLGLRGHAITVGNQIRVTTGHRPAGHHALGILRE